MCSYQVVRPFSSGWLISDNICILLFWASLILVHFCHADYRKHLLCVSNRADPSCLGMTKKWGLLFDDFCKIKSLSFITWEYANSFWDIFAVFFSIKPWYSRSPPWLVRESDIDVFECCICMLSEEVRDDSLVLFWSEGTCRVDESTSLFESRECERDEFILEIWLITNICNWPKSVGFFIVCMDSSLCTTWRIEEDTVILFQLVFCLLSSVFCISKKYSCIHLHSLDIGRSLEVSIVHELVIAYLVLLYSCDGSSVIHHRRYLCCFGSWSCTDIEDCFILLWCECEDRQHRCDGLEIYLSIIESASSLDGIFMDSVEYIDSFESIELLYYDSLLFEFFEYITSISLENIDTKRTFPRLRKSIKNGIVSVTKYIF